MRRQYCKTDVTLPTVNCPLFDNRYATDMHTFAGTLLHLCPHRVACLEPVNALGAHTVSMRQSLHG